MTARGSACALLIALVTSRLASGQSPRELRIEAGAVQIRQHGRDLRDGLVLGALIRQSDRRLAMLVSGAFTYAGDSVTAAQGIAAFAWRPTAESGWHTEGGATGAAFGVYELGRGGNVSSYLRERWVLENGSLWAGAAAGHTLRDDKSWHSTDLDIGASVRSGGLEASAALARLRTNDWPLMQASGIFLQAEAAAHDLQDAAVTVHYDHGPLTLDVSHTWRGGEKKTLAAQTALAWSVEYAVSPRYSFALNGGRQLADPVRGTPDVQLISAVIRMVVLPWREDIAAKNAPVATAHVVPGAEGVVLVVRVSAPDSARVEVAGSFSGWQPVPVRRTSDGWESQVTLRPGTHRVAVRINGGPWRSPANLGKVRDEFGGEAGIVVVP